MPNEILNEKLSAAVQLTRCLWIGLGPKHNPGEKRQPNCDKWGKMSPRFYQCNTEQKLYSIAPGEAF